MKPVNLIIVIMIAVSSCIINPTQTYGQTLFVTSPDSIQIAYEVHGDGSPALIFVHGWSCDRSYWKGQIEPFSRDHKVVAVDLAGHGESGFGRQHYTMEAFGKDVAAVIKNLNLKKVILAGHSMGSPVIAEAARNLPGIVAGLVMVDQYKSLGPGMTNQEVDAFVMRLRINFSDSTKAFVRRMFVTGSDNSLKEWVAADMSSAPPTVALEAVESTLHYSRRMPQTLSELKLPVIAINDNRRPTDLASMKQYGVEVIIMEGVGHFLMMEDPARFNELLKTAIKRLLNE